MEKADHPTPPMTRLLLLVLLATLASAPAFAQTCTTTWVRERVTNDRGDVFFVWSDGSWQSASRWSNGVPGPSDTACVLGPSDGRADFDVTSSAPVEVAGLVVGNRQTGPIRVILNAPATASSGGRVFGSGRIDGDLTIDGPFEVVDAWMSGQLTVGPQGTLIVAQSEANNGNGFTSQLGCASVQNNPLLGPLGLTVNGGRVEIRESVGVCGRVEWNGGTLAVQADDREGNRTLFRTYVAGGRFAPPGDFDDSGFYRNVTFDVDANTSVILGGFYRVSGTMSGTSDGDLSFSQNILTFGDGGLIVEESGVTFGVGGSQGLAIKVPQSSRRREYQITTEGGEIVNTGTLRFPTGSRRFNGVPIRNRGEIRTEGAIVYLAGGSFIDNQAGGTIRFVDGRQQPVHLRRQLQRPRRSPHPLGRADRDGVGVQPRRDQRAGRGHGRRGRGRGGREPAAHVLPGRELQRGDVRGRRGLGALPPADVGAGRHAGRDHCWRAPVRRRTERHDARAGRRRRDAGGRRARAGHQRAVRSDRS